MKKARYHKVRKRPRYGDRVSPRREPDREGVVFAGIPVGRGYSVCVDWGDDLVLIEPMSELLFNVPDRSGEHRR